MAAGLEVDKAIQTLVTMLVKIGELKAEQEECVYFFHQGGRHCFHTANRVWKKANMSACTVSDEIGSIAIP